MTTVSPRCWLAVPGLLAVLSSTLAAQDLPSPEKLLAALEERARRLGDLHCIYEVRTAGRGGAEVHRVWRSGGVLTVQDGAARDPLTMKLDAEFLWSQRGSWLQRLEWRDLHPFLSAAVLAEGGHQALPLTCWTLEPGRALPPASLLGPVKKAAWRGQPCWVLCTDPARLRAARDRLGSLSLAPHSFYRVLEQAVYVRAEDLAVAALSLVLTSGSEPDGRSKVLHEVRSWRTFAGGLLPAEVHSAYLEENGFTSNRPARIVAALREVRSLAGAPEPPRLGDELASGLRLASPAFLQARIAASPLDPHYRYQLAHHRLERLRETKSGAEVRSLLEDCDALDRLAPRSARRWELRLSCHLSSGQLDRALEIAKEGQRKGVLAANMELAWALFRAGRLDPARTIVEQALADGAKTGHDTYHARGLQYRILRKLARHAEADAVVVSLLSGKDVASRSHLVGRDPEPPLEATPEAAGRIARLLQEALAKEPDPHAYSWLFLASFRARAGQAAEASTALARALVLIRQASLEPHELGMAYEQVMLLHQQVRPSGSAYRVLLQAVLDPRLASGDLWLGFRVQEAIEAMPPADLVSPLLEALGSAPVSAVRPLLEVAPLDRIREDPKAWGQLTGALAARARAAGGAATAAFLGAIRGAEWDATSATPLLEQALATAGWKDEFLLDSLLQIAARASGAWAPRTRVSILARSGPMVRDPGDSDSPKPPPLAPIAELLERLARNRPDEPAVEYGFGMCRLRQGHTAPAGEALERAAAKMRAAHPYPGRFWPARYRGFQTALIEGLATAGRLGNARALLADAVEGAGAAPKHGKELLEALLRAALATGDATLFLEAGLPIYRAIQEPQEQMSCLHRLAQQLHATRDGPDADRQRRLLAQLAAASQNPLGLLVSGAAASEHRLHDEALPLLQRAVSLEPTLAAYWTLAGAYSGRGDNVGAASMLREAVRRLESPGDPDLAHRNLLTNLAHAVLRTGDRELAGEMAARLEALPPTEREMAGLLTADLAARLHEAAGGVEKARTRLEQLAQRAASKSDRARYLEQLGDLLVRAGRKEEGSGYYRQAHALQGIRQDVEAWLRRRISDVERRRR